MASSETSVLFSVFIMIFFQDTRIIALYFVAVYHQVLPIDRLPSLYLFKFLDWQASFKRPLHGILVVILLAKVAELRRRFDINYVLVEPFILAHNSLLLHLLRLGDLRDRPLLLHQFVYCLGLAHLHSKATGFDEDLFFNFLPLNSLLSVAEWHEGIVHTLLDIVQLFPELLVLFQYLLSAVPLFCRPKRFLRNLRAVYEADDAAFIHCQ